MKSFTFTFFLLLLTLASSSAPSAWSLELDSLLAPNTEDQTDLQSLAPERLGDDPFEHTLSLDCEELLKGAPDLEDLAKTYIIAVHETVDFILRSDIALEAIRERFEYELLEKEERANAREVALYRNLVKNFARLTSQRKEKANTAAQDVEIRRILLREFSIVVIPDTFYASADCMLSEDCILLPSVLTLIAPLKKYITTKMTGLVIYFSSDFANKRKLKKYTDFDEIALYALFKKLECYDFNKGALSTYLKTTIENELKDFDRKNLARSRNEKSVSDFLPGIAVDSRAPHKEAEDNEIVLEIQRRVRFVFSEKLSPDKVITYYLTCRYGNEQQILTLVDRCKNVPPEIATRIRAAIMDPQELAGKEVAELMGIEHATVRWRTHQARNTLAKELETIPYVRDWLAYYRKK